MKYLIKGTAVKINHKVYNIGDEITLTAVPKSLKQLLEPVKEVLARPLSGGPARRSSGRVIPAEMPESKGTVIPESFNRESKEPVILRDLPASGVGAEVSKKPRKRKNKTEK